MVNNIIKLMNEKRFCLLENKNNKLIFVKLKTKIEIILEKNKNRINYSSINLDYSIFNILDKDLILKLPKIFYNEKE